MALSVAERLELYSVPEPNTGCTLWHGARGRGGYGVIQIDGKATKAHRAAWRVGHGLIPKGLCVCHRCDVPECIEPSHLFLGTNADNTRDRDAKGRGSHGDDHWTRVHPEKLATGDNSGARKHPESLPRGDAHPSRLFPETRPRGEEHTSAKLRDPQVLEIRRRVAAGELQRLLAAEFHVCQATISSIKLRQSWAHLP